jgi:hypothetical protein
MFVVTEADAAAIRAVYQQRAGAGVRQDHRRVEAAATAAGEADAGTAAAVTSGALTGVGWRRGHDEFAFS